jgi:hypothetical protein
MGTILRNALHRAATPNANMAGHPKDLPRVERSAAPNTGNAKQDQKYQQKQEKLVAKQNQDRQKLQQQQDKEHQQLRNSRRMKRKPSRWSSGTSNRLSKRSKDTPSKCSRDNSHLAAEDLTPVAGVVAGTINRSCAGCQV